MKRRLLIGNGCWYLSRRSASAALPPAAGPVGGRARGAVPRRSRTRRRPGVMGQAALEHPSVRECPL